MKMNGGEGERYRPTRRSSTYQFDVELNNLPSDVIGAFTGRYNEEDERNIRFAQEFLSGFRYKPDWHFDIVRRYDSGTARLRITVMVIDSTKPVQEIPQGTLEGTFSFEVDGQRRMVDVEPRQPRIPISGEFTLPRLSELRAPKEVFQDFLHKCITTVEHHERDEWFRVNGVRPFDPHR